MHHGVGDFIKKHKKLIRLQCLLFQGKVGASTMQNCQENLQVMHYARLEFFRGSMQEALGLQRQDVSTHTSKGSVIIAVQSEQRAGRLRRRSRNGGRVEAPERRTTMQAPILLGHQASHHVNQLPKSRSMCKGSPNLACS